MKAREESSLLRRPEKAPRLDIPPLQVEDGPERGFSLDEIHPVRFQLDTVRGHLNKPTGLPCLGLLR